MIQQVEIEKDIPSKILHKLRGLLNLDLANKFLIYELFLYFPLVIQ